MLSRDPGWLQSGPGPLFAAPGPRLAVPVLRDYQVQAIDRLREAVAAGSGRVILVSPTGSGKTTIAARLIELAIARGSHVLFIAHRTELIEQCSARLALFGLPHGIIKAGFRPDPGQQVQVASIQTLVRRSLPPADLVVVDECHHASAASYRHVLDAYPAADVIGLTATPTRIDGKGLGDLFDGLVEAITVSEAIAQDYLMRTRVLAPSSPDLVGIRTIAGEFDPRTLALRVERPNLLGSIAEHWGKNARGMRSVLFAANVAHSQHLVSSLRGVGARAAHLDGETDPAERARVLQLLRDGELDVVSNCGILTEGWDLPNLGAVICARPTQSLALHVQMLGRVQRPAPGKTQALILDHAGNVHRHGFAEDDREWTLSASKAKRANSEFVAPVKTCKSCYLVVPLNTRTCPECGAAFVVEETEMREKAGELSELTAESAAERKRRREHERRVNDWLRLRTQAHYRRRIDGTPYQPNWALYKFRELHGCWPKREIREIWTEDQASALAERFGIDTSSRAREAYRQCQ